MWRFFFHTYSLYEHIYPYKQKLFDTVPIILERVCPVCLSPSPLSLCSYQHNLHLVLFCVCECGFPFFKKKKVSYRYTSTSGSLLMVLTHSFVVAYLPSIGVHNLGVIFTMSNHPMGSTHQIRVWPSSWSQLLGGFCWASCETSSWWIIKKMGGDICSVGHNCYTHEAELVKHFCHQP